MICTAAIYGDRPSARDAQHKIQRAYHFSTNLRYCEACDGFHLIANLSRIKLPKHGVEIISLLGQGFTWNEIAKTLDVTYRKVEWTIRALKGCFGAMSSSHLVAIAIAVGVLSPSEFVPAIKPTEEEQDARKNGEPRRVGGVVAPNVRGGHGKDTHGVAERRVQSRTA